MIRPPSTTRHVSTGNRARRGVSLLEVLLATTLLFGAVVVLAELAQIGRRHAESAGERVTAQLLCLRKLNEVVVGIVAATSGSGTFDDVPGWTYAVEVEPVDELTAVPGLVRVKVIVEQDPQAPEHQRRRNLRRFELTRWLPLDDESLEDPGSMPGDASPMNATQGQAIPGRGPQTPLAGGLRP